VELQPRRYSPAITAKKPRRWGEVKMDLQTLSNSAGRGHSRRVSAISGLLADRAGYSQAESQVIAQAALLHDCGKAYIPADILYKPSALTPGEYGIIKTHTDIGCELLNEAAQLLATAAIVAKQHHEYINGSGYHHMLGGEIHPYAKLIACADVFDALYSRRPYKEPWDISKIQAFFTEQSGKHFDPAMVHALFSVIDKVLALYQK
jgi:putative nucleotidyltransferase with HDIG domain